MSTFTTIIQHSSGSPSYACTAALSAHDSAAGHCQPMPPPETPGPHRQVWVTLLWGHCSFLLGPGVHKVLFVPSKSLFPQSCVNSGSSMVGLMATSSKRAYAIPMSWVALHGVAHSFIELDKAVIHVISLVSFL